MKCPKCGLEIDGPSFPQHYALCGVSQCEDGKEENRIDKSETRIDFNLFDKIIAADCSITRLANENYKSINEDIADCRSILWDLKEKLTKHQVDYRALEKLSDGLIPNLLAILLLDRLAADLHDAVTETLLNLLEELQNHNVTFDKRKIENSLQRKLKKANDDVDKDRHVYTLVHCHAIFNMAFAILKFSLADGSNPAMISDLERLARWPFAENEGIRSIARDILKKIEYMTPKTDNKDSSALLKPEKEDTTKNVQTLSLSKRNYNNCISCSGVVEERLCSHRIEYDGNAITFGDVPMGVCVKCGKMVLKPEIAKFLDWIIRTTRGRNVQKVALGTLEKNKNDRVVEPLIATLKHDNWCVRGGAARALGEIGDVRAVEPLSITALKDDLYIVRWVAAEALGKIGDARAIEPLITLLTKEIEQLGVLWGAVEALRKIGDAGTITRLNKLAQRNPQNKILKVAKEALIKHEIDLHYFCRKFNS